MRLNSDSDKNRTAGILLPIYSLPSKYGIGSFGKEAKAFIDFLKEAGQSWWQILPLGRTGYGNSPYCSFSTFAGNPFFIDLDSLAEEGLLANDDLEPELENDEGLFVNYKSLETKRLALLKKAAWRGLGKAGAGFESFRNESSWLRDYALYMALREHFCGKGWNEWDYDVLSKLAEFKAFDGENAETVKEIRMHESGAMVWYERKLACEIEVEEFIQYLFFKQWDELRDYARSKGIGIIGDIPVYVPLDSADVWSERQWFCLDEKGEPVEVAGCPPDAFSEKGQLWGNPLYDYEKMKNDGYGWWIRRIGGAEKLYDVVRIDHFRGFEQYWAVPYGAEDARSGKWKQGPGMGLVHVITSWFSNVEFIAEDLGAATEGLKILLSDSGLPGMKVLEFAFDAGMGSYNDHLPHYHKYNGICYVGTHDNAPLMGWLEDEKEENLQFAARYLNLKDCGNKEELANAVLCAGQASVSKLFVAQIQDYLMLGNEARTNTPGTVGDNWTWRVPKNQLTEELAEKIYSLTRLYGRC